MYPKKAQIEITTKCNLNCHGCLRGNNGKNMRGETYIKSLEFLKEFGVKEIHLHNWGEPMLFNPLYMIIRIAKLDGFRVGFTTNGTLLNYWKIFMLKRAGLDILDISYKRSYSKKLKKKIVKFYKFANRIGIDASLRCVVFNAGDYTEFVGLPYAVNQKVKMQRGMIKNKEWEREKPCRMMRNIIVILVDGTIVPCCVDTCGDLSLGSVYKTTPEKVKTKLDALEDNIINKKSKLCLHCTEVDIEKEIIYKL